MATETVKIKLEVENDKGKKEVKEFSFSLESLEKAYEQLRIEMRKANIEGDRMVDVMQEVDGKMQSAKLSVNQVVAAINNIRAERAAQQLDLLKKSGQSLNELGEKITGLGTRITGAITVPIVGAFAAAIRSSTELQAALEPIKSAFAGVATELGNALVPVVVEMTPALIELAGALSDVVKWFSDLDPGSKKGVLAVVAFAAAVGPAMMAVGQFIQTLGILKITMASLGGMGGLGGAATGLGGATGGAAAGGAGLGALGILGAVGGGISLGALGYDFLAKNFGVGGGTRLNQFATVGAYGIGRLFGGEQGGLAAAGSIGRATGAIGQPVIVYNNYGVDANNPYLRQALTPYMNQNARSRGQR